MRFLISDCSTCQVTALRRGGQRPARESCEYGHVGYHGRVAQQFAPLVEEADEGLNGRVGRVFGRLDAARIVGDPPVLEPAHGPQAIEVECHRLRHLQLRGDVGEGRVPHSLRDLVGADPRLQRLVVVAGPHVLVPKGLAAGNQPAVVDGRIDPQRDPAPVVLHDNVRPQRAGVAGHAPVRLRQRCAAEVVPGILQRLFRAGHWRQEVVQMGLLLIRCRSWGANVAAR